MYLGELCSSPLCDQKSVGIKGSPLFWASLDLPLVTWIKLNIRLLNEESGNVFLIAQVNKAMWNLNQIRHQFGVFFSFPGLYLEIKSKSALEFILFFSFLQTNVIRYKSTEFMTFSMCVATFVVSLLWTIYGQLVQDNFILVSGAFWNSLIMSKNWRVQGIGN